MNPLIILGIILVGLIAINLWLRGENRRRSLPCPTWFCACFLLQSSSL